MSESTWSSSPNTETYSAIQKAVAGYVLMPTDAEVIDCAGQGLRRAIDRLNTRNWNWLLTYDDITFVESQYDYVLTSWFKKPRNFEIWNTGEQSEFRLSYLPWGSFVKEHSNQASQGDPALYSVLNVNATGMVTLNAAPTSGWIAAHPSGRLLYYRKIQYPSATGTSLDVPSEAVAYLQAAAEGYTADRYDVTKSRDAYTRAEMFLRELVKDDNDVQTDWE